MSIREQVAETKVAIRAEFTFPDGTKLLTNLEGRLQPESIDSLLSLSPLKELLALYALIGPDQLEALTAKVKLAGSVERIAVLDTNQELPEIPEFQYGRPEEQSLLKRGAINYSKMLANFRRVLPQEGK